MIIIAIVYYVKNINWGNMIERNIKVGNSPNNNNNNNLNIYTYKHRIYLIILILTLIFKIKN